MNIFNHKKSILTGIIIALSALMGLAIHQSQKPQETNNLVKQSLTNNFDYLMQPLRSKYDCERVVLYKLEFNDPDNDRSYASITLNLKSTITERVVVPNAQVLNKVSIGLYSDILPQLLKHETVFFYVDQLKHGPLREGLESRNIIAGMWVDVSNNNDVVGMFGIGWNRFESVPHNKKYQELLNDMRTTAAIIGKTLTY